MDLIVEPRNVNLTEGGSVEICVEFAQGQILAERMVTFSASEPPSMSPL